jgi:hypothetical protein
MSPNTVTLGMALRIGVISDTHGWLRPQATAFLQGCDHILHGGDIGGAEILERLSAVAPVTAVRGNNDTQTRAASLPDTCLLQLGGDRVFIIHDLGQIRMDLSVAAVQLIVSGQRSSRHCVSAPPLFISIPAARDRAGSSCRSASRNFQPPELP